MSTQLQAGQHWGRLTLLRPSASPGWWVADCECGGIAVSPATDIRSGRVKSCGCLAIETFSAEDLTGCTFGRLTVAERSPLRVSGGLAFWRCNCICGGSTCVHAGGLRAGTTKSCGCLRKDLLKTRALRAELDARTERSSDERPELCTELLATSLARSG